MAFSFADYLKPGFEPIKSNNSILGNNCFFYHKEKKEFDFYNKIALIGVTDLRFQGVEKESEIPNLIRGQLFNLTSRTPNKIIDLGNLILGKSPEDSLAGFEHLLEKLIEKGAFPFVIGGTKDYLIPLSNIFKKKNKHYTIADIDSSFSCDTEQGKAMFKNIIEDNPLLFDYNIIGAQKHYIPETIFQRWKKMQFNFTRYGKIKEDLNIVEPYLRNSDILHIGLQAGRSMEVPGILRPNPNGFDAWQMCRLATFAGLSENINALLLTGYELNNDINSVTLALQAQIIWYFLEGFDARIKEIPSNSKGITKFVVRIEDYDNQLVFYKSNITGKWWFEIKVTIKGKEKAFIYACNYSDYICASNNEIPELWMQCFSKLS